MTLMMKAVSSSETFVNICQTIFCKIPCTAEDQDSSFSTPNGYHMGEFGSISSRGRIVPFIKSPDQL
jgi:hypothetical protein